jgi:hypothetical protein
MRKGPLLFPTSGIYPILWCAVIQTETHNNIVKLLFQYIYIYTYILGLVSIDPIVKDKMIEKIVYSLITG